MRNRTVRKRFVLILGGVLAAAVCAFFAVRLSAGAVKTGGQYTILDDSFTIAGAAGIGDSTYRLVFSAGQPVGQMTLSTGPYEIEGGYVSGITAVYQIAKSNQRVEAPAGYTGAAGDIVPGSRITYKLDFTNYGEAAETGTTIIEDSIPANLLSYASGTISLTLNDTTTAQTDALDGDACAYMATAAIHCLLPNVGAGATGALSFKAVVQ